jgi:hypothetical protein
MSGGWDRLTPEGQRFFAEIEKLKEQQVFVGFQAGQVADDRGVDMAQIAMFNELGTSTAPSRPFLRMSVDENEDKITTTCGRELESLKSGGTAETILRRVGALGVRLVQEKIGSGSFEPNAESTIRKKGSDKPLIDTGRMRQSVKYVIKRRGES